VAKKLIEARTGASLPGVGRIVRLSSDYRDLMGRLAGFRYRDIQQAQIVKVQRTKPGA